MPPIAIDEILSLPVSERLRVVEMIWDSIAAEPETVPVTDAQKKELEARMEEYRRDPSIAVPWEIARKRLRGEK